ncbi:hypothetical protein QCA50_014077 [Cerrena zonata]|uniref:RING-type domain-containing protein n=1 Tax=Cerrena zonata TaxID=2478898 RepID=A0AAW0FT16_9APHY
MTPMCGLLLEPFTANEDHQTTNSVMISCGHIFCDRHIREHFRRSRDCLFRCSGEILRDSFLPVKILCLPEDKEPNITSAVCKANTETLAGAANELITSSKLTHEATLLRERRHAQNDAQRHLEAELDELVKEIIELRTELESLEQDCDKIMESVSFLEDRLHQLENLDIAPFTLPSTAVDSEPTAKRPRHDPQETPSRPKASTDIDEAASAGPSTSY